LTTKYPDHKGFSRTDLTPNRDHSAGGRLGI
jgi:hypothetical protein